MCEAKDKTYFGRPQTCHSYLIICQKLLLLDRTDITHLCSGLWLKSKKKNQRTKLQRIESLRLKTKQKTKKNTTETMIQLTIGSSMPISNDDVSFVMRP